MYFSFSYFYYSQLTYKVLDIKLDFCSKLIFKFILRVLFFVWLWQRKKLFNYFISLLSILHIPVLRYNHCSVGGFCLEVQDEDKFHVVEPPFWTLWKERGLSWGLGDWVPSYPTHRLPRLAVLVILKISHTERYKI